VCRRANALPGDSVCFDARIRNWDEEWLSELLAEALRLKDKSAAEGQATAH
jgi:hypothetical protein